MLNLREIASVRKLKSSQCWWAREIGKNGNSRENGWDLKNSVDLEALKGNHKQ